MTTPSPVLPDVGTSQGFLLLADCSSSAVRRLGHDFAQERSKT